MTSKERVRTALSRKQPDRVPANFEATPSVWNKLMKYYGFSQKEELLNYYQIDYREVVPDYIGPELKVSVKNGVRYLQTPHGYVMREQWTGKEYNYVVEEYPFDENTTIEDINRFDWVNPDWFDYSSIKRQCEKYSNKALIFGHEGPFQVSTFMMNMDDLFVKMALEPEVAHALFNRFVQFETEYYERILLAGEGMLDVLRPHDDYGTQIGLLFSVEMWKEFFADNTKKLVDLAHRHNCFYQQHSCGAVSEIIPELIQCGIDSLEPIQRVEGMDPEILKNKYGKHISFQGGIDTQSLLPFGTVEQVCAETRNCIKILGKGGGYVLMASQGFEADVPIKNIECVYKTSRQ